VNENNSSTMSFDRMRNMLNRAAEVRESEQQQIFDALDEIHARLAPVESLGSVRKRLSELPDRTEVSVLAERLDEALAKLEAQDSAIAGLGRAVDSVVDKLATPFAQLDGRLDGVAGRFEGVGGRMDGLEDKLTQIHRRLDEFHQHLDKQDSKLDALPREVHVPLKERLDVMETALRGQLNEVGEGVHEHLDGTREALHRSVTESTDAVGTAVAAAREALYTRLVETNDGLFTKLTDANNELRGSIEASRESVHEGINGVHHSLNESRDQLRGGIDESREALRSEIAESKDSLHRGLGEARDALRASVESSRDDMRGKVDEATTVLDPTERLDALAERLEQVTSKLDAMASRLDAVENGIGGRIGELATGVDAGIRDVRSTVAQRPDNDSLISLVRTANEESERRNAGQLDEAMATFAELILGGGAPTPAPPPMALPRQQRRARGPKSANGKNGKELDIDAELAEGA
jgi:chromosome segregation ATPase